ncbi:DEAD/DEAH box helicase [Jeotgalibacillus sp. S-D1]|uniref:DEAD/DEAH box helicase n=1 Tax=Jeotgalibacillus sp. S-D1 TaxID=2552189 RepID=UPI00105A8EAC|nr:DEAD/DEAH box helicase [Jeotgalibacillus sp. S-D1]TDL31848.1 DEAD/DEAH box helicase [Jeotgalibacillus sp. S-D1]
MNHNSFKDYQVSAEILRALERLNYTQPTQVQKEVIPVALQKRDLSVKSQTGSGKTASFGIPLCELVEWEENKPQALVLTPTRELADQVKEDITNIGRFKRIKAVAIYGKQPFSRQKTELKQKNHVVVGTPGRVLDHIQKGTLHLDKIRFLVIDEADEMLNMGFIEQVEAIIQALPVERMTMLFSATLPKDVEKLCHKYMKNPKDITIESSSKGNDHIQHSLYHVKESHKFGLLKDVTIMEKPDSCIIFCRTKDRVDELARQLDRIGYTCDKIHGGMAQEDRFAVMNEFKRGEFRYLIATDVAARGIDIDSITHVINYDIPLEKESYVHRTGRTGRAGKTGIAISFVTEYEDRFLSDIQEYIDADIIEKAAPAQDEVAKEKEAFDEKMDEIPEMKIDKRDQVSEDIMKLYFNGGKKKKLRAVDFVGTIAKIDGIQAEDIGIITIQENVTYVEILNGKGPHVLQVMKTTPVKGKNLKVHRAREK